MIDSLLVLTLPVKTLQSYLTDVNISVSIIFGDRLDRPHDLLDDPRCHHVTFVVVGQHILFPWSALGPGYNANGTQRPGYGCNLPVAPDSAEA